MVPPQKGPRCSSQRANRTLSLMRCVRSVPGVFSDRNFDEYGAYFSPSWTAFQADRGRDFSVIVDGVSV